MSRLRFGVFDFDPENRVLKRNGDLVHIQAQPAKLLALLVAARGEVVTREALRDSLWNDGTVVDFDRGLNFAIGQVRTALGDSADSPTFIKTIPKRGYQFIAPLSPVDPAPLGETPDKHSRRSVMRLVLPVTGGVAAAAAVAVFRPWRAREGRIAVARFENETGNPSLDRFADTITDLVVAELTSATAGRHGVIGNAEILRRPRGFQNLEAIAGTLRADFVILGQLKQDGPRTRVLAHLIEMPGETHLTVSRLEVNELAGASPVASRIVSELARAINSSRAASR